MQLAPSETTNPACRGLKAGTLRLLLACLLALVPVAGLIEGPLHPAAALADDDGGDDDGGGGGRGGGRNDGGRDSDRPGGNLTRPAPAKAKKAAVRKAVVQRPRPVVVALDLPDTGLDPIIRQGFTILSDNRLAASGLRVMRLRLPSGMSLNRARRILAEQGAAASDINTYYAPQAQEDCAKTADCAFRAMAGWTLGSASACQASPRIGLVETHLQLMHPALAGQKIDLIDVAPPGQPKSSADHGTAVAALLAGARGSIAEGLLPDAHLVIGTPFYRAGQADRAEAFDIIRAIDAVVTRKPDVLNLSLAGPPNAALELQLQRIESMGIPVVAAAGNNGARNKPLFPAGYDTTLAVTAITSERKIFRRAPRGSHIDFAAPGVGMQLADGSGGIAERSGTSFAAPFVAAMIAVLRERQPQRPVASIVEEIAGKASDLGKPGKDAVFGWGLINASHLCSAFNEGSYAPAAQ